MSDQEMMDKFLSDNKVTICQDNHRISNGQSKKNNIEGYSNLRGMDRKSREKECEECGEKYIEMKDEFRNRNIKVYDGLCSVCRRTETENKFKNKLIIEKFGTLELHKEYKEGYHKIHSLLIEDMKYLKDFELIDYLKIAKRTIAIKENKSILLKINKLESLSIGLKSIDNWDDWNTPLGGEND